MKRVPHCSGCKRCKGITGAGGYTEYYCCKDADTKQIEGECHMQFKDLEWKGIISDGTVVCSHCEINLCGVVRIEFRINHEPAEGKYCQYSFGKGSIRRLRPDMFDSLDGAKSAAYRIYSNEMERIKKAVDYLVEEESY